MSKNFIDKYYEEDAKEPFWSLNKKIGVSLVALFMTVIMITTGCTQGNTDDTAASPEAPVEIPQDTVKTGNDGVNAAIAPDDTSAVMENEAIKKDTMVAMSVENLGRSDPFLPEAEKNVGIKTSNKHLPKPPAILLPPPETLNIDTTATEVMTTKVSGIMYDKLNPSAILNIGGSDYLVRTGDIINGYKVLSIARQTVTVQNGANIYKAGVGELFNSGQINFNTISNLEGKFGGRKNSANR